MSHSTLGRALGTLLLLAFIGLGGPVSQAQTAAGSSGSGIRLLDSEPSYLDLGVGAFDIQGHRESSTTAEGRVEFRYGQKLFFLGPAVGVLANPQGGVFGYAGVYTDIAFGRFVLTPLGGVGAYHRGGSEDLGGVFQFRISANLAYEFDNHSRLGANFAHISNAGIHNRNPGDNEVLLTYALPLPF